MVKYLEVPDERQFKEILSGEPYRRGVDHWMLLEYAIRYLICNTNLDANGIADYLYPNIEKWRPQEWDPNDPVFEHYEVLWNVEDQYKKETDLRVSAESKVNLIGKDLRQYMNAIDIKAPLIEGLISRGELVMFFAPSGIGKSSFVQSLCAYACAGVPVFELFEVPQPVKSLYINLEMSDAETGVRLESMFDSLGKGIENFEVDTLLDFDITRPEDQQRLLDTVKHKRPDIVVLDPLEAMHHKDENSASEMGLVIKPLRDMTHILNCSFIIVHHSGAPRYDNRGRLLPRRIRGSSVIEDKVDNVIEIIETDNTNIKRLHFTKARSVMLTRRQDLLFEFDWDSFLVRLVDDPELRQRYTELTVERHKKILPLLKLLSMGLSTRQIASYVDVVHSTIVRWKTGIREPTQEHIDRMWELVNKTQGGA